MLVQYMPYCIGTIRAWAKFYKKQTQILNILTEEINVLKKKNPKKENKMTIVIRMV